METLSRRLCAIFAALALAAGMSECGAQSEASEQEVKAAFLCKFTGYVEWPEGSFASADAPVVIAVLGDEALATALEQVASGHAVNGRRVSVRRMKAGEPVEGLHILFVGKSEGGRMNQVLRSAWPRSVLTVTDSEGALEQGSVINFVMAGRRVRFEISLQSAERSKLKLSSRLLAVAAQVRPGTP